MRVRRIRKALGSQLGRVVPDRRTRLRDLSCLPSYRRVPSTRELQFFSPIDNIGNYLPVMGIQNMIGHAPDAWSVWDEHIDYEFINRSYQSVIIGGAGLLHRSFEPFWREFVDSCTLPTIIWGVGICVPDADENPGVSRELLSSVRHRFDLVNVRDDLTSEWYGWQDVSVTACPSLLHLSSHVSDRSHSGILYSHHAGLAESSEIDAVTALCSAHGPVDITDNRQSRRHGIDDIVSLYDGREAVVASRLHGAIIAAGLGRPFVALARDEKLRAFQRQFGNGLIAETPEDVPDLVVEAQSIIVELDSLVDDIVAFGHEARSWLDTFS